MLRATLLGMRRAMFWIALIAAALVAGAPASGAPQLDALRVASAGDDNATPLLYADKAGLFRKAGIDLQFSKMNSGAAVAAAIAGGALDIGKSSMTGLIAAHLRGIDFTLVAPSGLYVKEHPIGALVVAADSSIQSARDFVGKTISASALNDINVVAARAWLEQQGVDPASVHFIELPESAVAAALAQHRIDGSTVLNPVLAELTNSGKARVVAPVFDAISGRFMISGWFAGADYVAKHRDIVARFARVMQQAEDYANTHHAETMDLVAQFTGLDVTTIAGMVRPTYPAVLDPHDIQPIVDAEFKYKAIDRSFSAAEMISPTALRGPK
jgi:NitT/TauT family transport system substrate-binding protein